MFFLKNEYFFYCHRKLYLSDISCSDNLVFRELTSKDINNNAIFNHKGRKGRYINYLKCGHRFFGFVNTDNKVVSYLWTTCGVNITPLSRYCELMVGKDKFYIWDCRTLSLYKNKGLYKCGLKEIAAIAAHASFDKVMICNLKNNYISNKTMKSLN